MTSTRRWRWRLAAVVVLVSVALGVTHAITSARHHDLYVRVVPPGSGAAPRALLGGLAEGQAVVGWHVDAIEGPMDGELRVHLSRDGVRFAVMIRPRGAGDELAPLQTERYAIFFGHVEPPETPLPANTVTATTHALARRIRAHEADVIVPGLSAQ